MKHLLSFLSAILVTLTFTSCHPYEEWDDSAEGNFDALWTILDEHYCFFDEKDIDWNEVGQRYRARLVPGITQQELFALCAEMIDELEDGHTNLISPFDISYYDQWWTDYPQDFDIRVLQEHYLGFDYKVSSGIYYKIMPNNIGYIYYPSFSSTIGEGNLDWILADLAVCDALIIDIRDNGGGQLTNIETFLRRFIHEPTLAGYIRHKTGPGHGQFSEPYPFYYYPAEAGRMTWHKPIALLINRSCFSAANNFAAIMKSLPNVSLIGSRTGGGGGMPFSAELPNGWGIRFSACPITDSLDRQIETGVDPTEGCEVHSLPQDFVLGIDPILDFALSHISGQ